MFRNYIKIAVRTLMKNKLFSFINIFGLALSMAICMLVLLRVKDQLSYDKFLPQTDRTYRIISQLTNKQGTDYRFATSPLPFLGNLTANYNLIENAIRIYRPGTQQVTANKKSLELNGAFADDSFFKVFGFTFKTGNKSSALQSPNSIVLSKNSAERLFGKG
ncbi:MAG: ABC transporter permease, partial [Chitinophagaceae bacterium]|nr:ABC transporter permease [Chitinophagaceae bacterium]